MRFVVLVMAAIVVDTALVQAQEKSAFEKDSTGWIDLLPHKDLKNWKRVGLDQGMQETSPWSVNGDVLVCQGAPSQGAGAKEMLLYDRSFTDGVFHLECRFPPQKGKQDYNSGAYVRSLDGRVWHQIQIAHLDIPPFMGDLFGDLKVNDKTERVIIRGDGPDYVNPPGQWNTFEIMARDKEITVWLNGHSTLAWKECAVKKGMVGVQCEFFNVEFRNLKFKPTEFRVD